MAVEKPAKPFVWLRLPSGTVKKHDLPLPKALQQQLAKRLLTQVEQDGSPPAETSPPAVPEPVKPKAGDPKNMWVAWALHTDADLDPEAAEVMTKADLMEQYG